MAERRCEDPHCNKVMAAGEIRQTDPDTGLLVCPSCLNNPNRSQMSATASMVALAHDGGDGRVINHCLGGETRFMTTEGLRTLEEMAGQRVTLLTAPLGQDRGAWVEAEIRDFGEQELFAVTLRRNRQTKVIRATAGHRWFVRRPDRVLTTADLKPGHRLAHARHARIHPGDDHEGIRAGLLFGDGAVVTRGEQTYGAITLWGEKADLGHYFTELAEHTQAYPARTPSGVSGLRFTSGMKGATKDLPDIASDPGYLYGWLRGYMAADGTVDKQGIASLSSSVREHLEFVRDVSNLLGIGTYGISERQRRGYGEQDSPLFTLRFVSSDLGEDFFLRRSHRERWKPTGFDRLGWTVVSVEPTGVTETVYCAVVPGTESFVLEDNILTGNCPFCGSGGVVGGSTGTVECTFCNSHFTVQVQPKHINSPQTVNGQPVHIPGMPDESEIGAPVPGAEPVTGTPPEGEAAPTVPGISDADLEEEMFATAEGHLLDRRSYAQYLAVRAARDEEERQAVLAQIRQANIRHVVAAKAREQMGLDDR